MNPRILHVPGRTPYARKLPGAVNETVSDGVEVPRDASFPWLEAKASFGFFDVLHIQSMELTGIGPIERVLERCAREGKGVVATIHDLDPLFPEAGADLADKIGLACRFACAVVTLTARAAAQLAGRFGVDPARIQVIPHGPVLPPGHPLWDADPVRNDAFTVGMFGGFRPNRSFLTAAVNARHGLGARVKILSRGLNPVELGPGAEAFQVAALAAADPRLTLALEPFPSDDAVAGFVQGLDLLVLPYLFGTHSGQLELAMDLRVPVAAPDLGCFREQWQTHAAHVPEPFWFPFTPGDPWGYGAPLLRALQAAERAWRERIVQPRPAFQAVRVRELEAILSAHRALYARAARP